MKDLAEIIHFGKNTSLSTKCQQNVLSVQFYKNFKGPSLNGQWVKNLETFTRHYF